MFNYVVVVNDGGEMKTVTASQIDDLDPGFAEQLDGVLNVILDVQDFVNGDNDPEPINGDSDDQEDP